MAQAIVLTAPQKMALMTMESQAKQMTSLDIFNEFTNMGLAAEAITALKEISLKTAKDISGKVIEVGKIIINKIIEFIKENKGMAIGMVLGAAVGALAGFIPFIGPFIAPLTAGAGAIVGSVIGNSMNDIQSTDDFAEKVGAYADSPVTATLKSILDMAKKFFHLLKEIFLAIFKPEELK